MKIQHIVADAISATSIQFVMFVAIVCAFVVVAIFAKYFVK